MQNNTEESLNQAIDDDAGASSGAAGSAPTADTPASGSTNASSKKTSSKKAAKKKAGKKKVAKKKASKKKASKKKASKKKSSKKRGKKKASRKAAASPWERLAVAAEHMREAALELAEQEASHGRRAIDDFVGATRAKLSDLESVAERGIARITGK